MAENDESKAETSAEKAYAAAAEAAGSKPASETPAEPTPVEFPSAEQRAAETPPAAEAPVETPKAEPAAKSAPAKSRKAPARSAAKPKAKKAKPVTPAKAAATKKKSPAAKPSKPKTIAVKKTSTSSQIKETPMTTTKTTKATEGFKKAVSDTQAKAKQAFEKTSAMFGEYGEFTKGNVEAVVESGKILASGLQEFGNELVAEGKTSVETLTSDVKELAAVKSPTEFVKVQSDIMRRNFDTAVSYGSKNTEAMLKLANDAFAPISGRFSLAMEKIRKAA
jgi:phasin family protein